MAKSIDIDAWLDDLDLPQREVRICGKGSLVTEYAQLQRDLSEARKGEQAVGEGDEGLNHGGQSAGLQSRLDEVKERIEASMRTFVMQALSPDQLKALVDKYAEDPVELTLQAMALQMVEPAMTVEQLRKMRSRIGQGQFQKLVDTGAGVTHDQDVDLPFS